MAHAASYESSFHQFLEPPQPPKNVDRYNLYANTSGTKAANWPIEGSNSGISDGGTHIGWSQVMTDANQTSDPNEWNWITNAADGVSIFSGTPPAEYATGQNKMQTASAYATLVEASERQCIPTYRLSVLCQSMMPCTIFYGTGNPGCNPVSLSVVLGARLNEAGHPRCQTSPALPSP